MPRLLLTLASFMIVIAGLREAQAIVVPFILSAFIATLAVGPLVALVKKNVSPSIALTAVLGGLLIIGVVIISLLGSSIADFTQSLPRYQVRLEELVTTLASALSKFGVDVSYQELIKENIDPSSVLQLAGSTLSQLGNVLSQSFLIFLTVAFMLAEATTLPEKIEAAFGKDSKVASGVDSFVESLVQYMSIKTIVSALTGITVTIVLSIMEIDFPILWGVLAFLLNYVPNLGSLLAAVPVMLLAVIQYSFTAAAVVGVAYLIINTIYGNVLEPRLMGRELGISTLVVFLSLVFWGWVLGPVGMLLSVPLTMAVKIALESKEETNWIGILLSQTPSPEGSSGEEPETA
ncbi:UNVERIFIED_CONTAM: hypothetical protein GTU68_003016 [Idotea baltica]|nr:hypothetical protein [Idotea baltica]